MSKDDVTVSVDKPEKDLEKELAEEEEDEEVGCCMKYFCEGQKLDRKTQEKLEEGNVSIRYKYRKQLAMLIPFAIVQTIWWTCFIKYNSFHKFVNYSGKKREYLDSGLLGESNTKPWYMSVTMIFGSMVAGMTSEGGASVAFPVMTLIFDIKPFVAKQFSFLIQSVGMTAAAFVILFMKVQVEWKSIIYCTIGGVAGLIFGLEEIAPELTPPYSKMYFVVIWASFALSLYYLNRIYGRTVYIVLDPPHLPKVWRSANLVSNDLIGTYILNWKALVLLAAGFLGGIFTSISGSGIDICSFSVLTLLFRISEKTATPTSVILMAINTMVASGYTKWFMREGFSPLAWEFFSVCAPIVVVGAPLGSMLGSYVHRLVLAAFVYVTDTVQLAGALYVVKPWTTDRCHHRPGGPDCRPLHLCWSSAAIFVSGLVTFYLLQKFGEMLILRNNKIEKEAEAEEAQKHEWAADGQKTLAAAPDEAAEEQGQAPAEDEDVEVAGGGGGGDVAVVDDALEDGKEAN